MSAVPDAPCCAEGKGGLAHALDPLPPPLASAHCWP